jgi:hypothetical protein
MKKVLLAAKVGCFVTSLGTGSWKKTRRIDDGTVIHTISAGTETIALRFSTL